MTQSLLAVKAQTRYLSENELRFTVPALPSSRLSVQLIGGPHGALTLEISASTKSLGVVPSSLEIASAILPHFFSKSIMMHLVAVSLSM